MTDQTNIVDITEANLQEVLQQSVDKPVLLFVGVASDETSNTQLAITEALAMACQGKFILARLDAEAQRMLAQQLINQLQITALPGHVVLHGGRPVDVFVRSPG